MYYSQRYSKMLIESAFLKLPELMLSSYQHQGNVEAMVVQHLATGIQMELNCRSVPFAYNHITIEKPYPNQNKRGTLFRSDLLFEAIGTVPNTSRLDQYGFKEKQWVEAKSFFGIKNSSPAKTKNIGRILKDMVRLCLLPEELQGSIRQNGRYILLVFDSHPKHYLALSDRDWLKAMFDKMSPTLSLDLKTEKKSLVKSIVNSDTINAQIEVSLSKQFFEPIIETPSPVYWGYLLRINDFKISINGKHIASSSVANEHWDANKIETLRLVKEEFTKLLRGDEGDITS
jgi:hypothetical protein